MQGSVMLKPEEPVPIINEDLPLENVSPEDFIPNPKTIAALLAKGGMAVAGMTSKEALKEARTYAKSLPFRDQLALKHFVDVDSPYHSSYLNEALRKGVPLNSRQQEHNEILTRVLRNAPRTDTTLNLHRGMPKSVVDLELPDPAYMSVTTSPLWAKRYAQDVSDESWNYADKMGNPLGAAVRMKAPVGTPLVDPDIEMMHRQSELVLPRYSTIKGGNLILPPEFQR
jgi:hypothetical protein